MMLVLFGRLVIGLVTVAWLGNLVILGDVFVSVSVSTVT